LYKKIEQLLKEVILPKNDFQIAHRKRIMGMGNSKNLLYRNSENVLWRSIGGELQLKFN
jgi:hypothetical protein